MRNRDLIYLSQPLFFRSFDGTHPNTARTLSCADVRENAGRTKTGLCSVLRFRDRV